MDRRPAGVALGTISRHVLTVAAGYPKDESPVLQRTEPASLGSLSPAMINPVGDFHVSHHEGSDCGEWHTTTKAAVIVGSWPTAGRPILP